jgi:hypothetical protein
MPDDEWDIWDEEEYSCKTEFSSVGREEISEISTEVEECGLASGDEEADLILELLSFEFSLSVDTRIFGIFSLFSISFFSFSFSDLSFLYFSEYEGGFGGPVLITKINSRS